MDKQEDLPGGQFQWRFYRIGGLDQVTLQTNEELRRLAELDPKLWVALSCPINGLQFDARTLQLMDSDKDGRIRIPDVLDAVNWLMQRLKNPSSMTGERHALPLEYICEESGEGRQMLAAARHLLGRLGKPEAAALSQKDVAGVREEALKNLLNGDGVFPPQESMDEDLRAFVSDIMKTLGSVPDASGEAGINKDLLDRFMDEARSYGSWLDEETAFRARFRLGEATADSYATLRDLTPKIDDYFTRCRLVEFDERAAPAVNVPESVLNELGAGPLSLDERSLVDLPLARAEQGRPLPFGKGLNPAWDGKVHAFYETVVRPLLGERDNLTEEDWQSVKSAFTEYDALVSREPQPLKELGPDRIRGILKSDMQARLESLFVQDEAIAPEIGALEDVERMVLYHRHLYHFLMNFVSFCDFYAGKPTTFQNGTLYIDGRSCSLCVPVDNIETHASSASSSYLCLLYLKCIRQETGDTMNIAAAMTAGDAEFLLPGRNGVFVDCLGAVWDAVLVKLVENPISIRTAMTAPYRRFGRMITDQVEKFTADKDAALTQSGAKAVQELAASAAAPPAAPSTPGAQPFDITKSVGVLAAVGLALGALGTALATIAASVLSLSWWQLPLLVLGIMVIISGPSMVLAWLKLRKRTLGPVLDASGWAVNTRIPINFTLGGRLTDTAVLPPNADRQLLDPLHYDNPWKRRGAWILLVSILAGCALGGWWAWDRFGKSGGSGTVEYPAESQQSTGTTQPEVAVPAPQNERGAGTQSGAEPDPS